MVSSSNNLFQKIKDENERWNKEAKFREQLNELKQPLWKLHRDYILNHKKYDQEKHYGVFKEILEKVCDLYLEFGKIKEEDYEFIKEFPFKTYMNREQENKALSQLSMLPLKYEENYDFMCRFTKALLVSYHRKVFFIP
jgi:hypothetical protein